MKFIIAILLTALLGYAAPLYFTWWSFAVTSFVVALAIQQKPWKAFVCGFSGLLLLWGTLAFLIDNANDHILSNKMVELLPVGSYIVLIIITAFIGGLVSGLAALTGSYARKR